MNAIHARSQLRYRPTFVRNELSVYHDSQAREQSPADLADIARCSETGCGPNCHAGCFAPEFESASLRADLAMIVRFSKQSRSAKEIGSGQQWGRISEFPSGDKTIEWAADQFRKAGIADAHVQAIGPGQPRGLLAATLMEVKLLGDPALGAGSSDVVLQSARLPGSHDANLSGSLREKHRFDAQRGAHRTAQLLGCPHDRTGRISAGGGRFR
jgi:hypothetical protein